MQINKDKPTIEDVKTKNKWFREFILILSSFLISLSAASGIVDWYMAHFQTDDTFFLGQMIVLTGVGAILCYNLFSNIFPSKS